VPPDKRDFDSEILHSLELGFKAENADRTVGGDVALFYMRRNDQQVQTGEQTELGNPGSFVLYTDNAARGENYGVEGTLRWRPMPRLLLDLRAAMLETRYLGYRFGERNLDGREQAHAPQFQYDLGLEYSDAQGWFTRVDFAGLDDFYFDVSHDERAPSRVLTHLKGGYSGKHWRAEVWVRNVFDRYYSQRGFRFGNEPPDFTATRYVQAGDSRHAGVTVAYTFR
jgi:iron complex outermembrane receptor protein